MCVSLDVGRAIVKVRVAYPGINSLFSKKQPDSPSVVTSGDVKGFPVAYPVKLPLPWKTSIRKASID